MNEKQMKCVGINVVKSFHKALDKQMIGICAMRTHVRSQTSRHIIYSENFQKSESKMK